MLNLILSKLGFLGGVAAVLYLVWNRLVAYYYANAQDKAEVAAVKTDQAIAAEGQDIAADKEKLNEDTKAFTDSNPDKFTGVK